jgi:hypothetical protein
MKTLKQIQEENRKFIIMANNPTAKTYDEALEMELEFGCEVIIDNINCPITITYESVIKSYYAWGNKSRKDLNFGSDRYIKLIDDNREEYVQKIIGKPLTLSRVLNALRNYFFYKIWYFCFDVKSCNIYGYNHKEEIIFTAYWDLEKETLEEKSEETQRKFNEVISEI